LIKTRDFLNAPHFSLWILKVTAGKAGPFGLARDFSLD
jgi:hypothetical protein